MCQAGNTAWFIASWSSCHKKMLRGLSLALVSYIWNYDPLEEVRTLAQMMSHALSFWLKFSTWLGCFAGDYWRDTLISCMLKHVCVHKPSYIPLDQADPENLPGYARQTLLFPQLCIKCIMRAFFSPSLFPSCSSYTACAQRRQLTRMWG